MNRFSQAAVEAISRLGPRALPFADVASRDLPLGRLLRLSLFQVTVGMALVLLVGTLNRVMIVELSVPASVVAVMVALPLVFAPFRALIGHRSDTHRSALGWRRVPFIWKGTLLQFGGFAIMPFALLVLAGKGHAAEAPAFLGYAGAGLAFLLVVAGVHTVQTAGLALATDLAPPEDQPKVVGLMYVMLLLGMVGSALAFGALLQDFSPGRLIRVIQGAAVVTVVLNGIALWKQEARDLARRRAAAAEPDFLDAWHLFVRDGGTTRRLVVIALGTLGFAMADVLLEPFGGEALGLAVADTTRLTATFAVGGLAGLALASRLLARGADPMGTAAVGVAIGIPAFGCVAASAAGAGAAAFVGGTFLIGLGAGLFGHGTLTATMRMAPREQAGLALGAWGAVQATAAGVAMALAGILRDAVAALPGGGTLGVATPYLAVFALEIALLVLALAVMLPVAGIAVRSALRRRGT